MTLLEFKAVNATYGYRNVLQDLSVTFQDKQRVAILGHNGSGKSTLLKCAIGMLDNCEGTIVYRGNRIQAGRVADNARLGIGFAIQGHNVFPSLTVERNLKIAGLFSGGGDMKTIYDIFPLLAERAKQRADTLSGGQQQMLAIGMALMTSPSILMLDEPTVGLAPAVAQKVFAALDRIADDMGLPILVVEQNVVPALRFAQRAVILKQGKIVYDGPCEPLMDDKALLEFY